MSGKPVGLEQADIPILRACVAGDREFPGALRRWEENLEMRYISGDHLRFVPLLYRRAEQLGITLREHGIARGVYLKSWYQHLMEHARFLDLLQATGLHGKVLLLKGHGLHPLVYRDDPPTRPAADLDFLVHRAERKSLALELLSQGLRSKKKSPLRLQLLNQRSLGLTDSRGELDMHWGIFDYSPDPELENRLFMRSIEVVVRGCFFRTLNPTDHLLHTLLHGAPKNVVSPSRWVVDAHLLVATGEIDWSVFSQEVITNRWSNPVYQQLLLLKNEFDCPVPDSALHGIRAVPASRLSIALRWRNSSNNRPLRLLTKLLFRDQVLLAHSLGLKWSVVWLVLLTPVSAAILLVELVGAIALGRHSRKAPGSRK